MNTKLPWEGGKQRLTPDQVRAFVKIHEVAPFDMLYCGKYRAVHLWGGCWQSMEVLSKQTPLSIRRIVGRLKGLLGQPKTENWNGSHGEKWIEKSYQVLGANHLSLQYRPQDNHICFLRQLEND